MAVKKQLATVIDLNKCLGCQTCTMTCKKLWSNEEGQETMYWFNVETRPGRGYPEDWADTGVRLPIVESFGTAWTFDYKRRLFEGGDGPVTPDPRSGRGTNWDEDQGGGEFPNSYYFYLPRTCNHCTDPPCLKACPRKAIYKRDEDGLVLVDENKCTGSKLCVAYCPYKKMYFNPVKKKAQKCVGCLPRTEKGLPFACAASCPGRCQFVGDLLDPESTVHQLVKKWEVALPLLPESGTQPNVFYVPPLSPPQEDDQGQPTTNGKIPLPELRRLFGPGVQKSIDVLAAEREKKQIGQDSELMNLLIALTESDLFSV
jgi:dimethylsulfide dehydrogenase subunit beta/complex iron-sulfur molybdoenzyme family reductase subunit beta